MIIDPTTIDPKEIASTVHSVDTSQIDRHEEHLRSAKMLSIEHAGRATRLRSVLHWGLGVGLAALGVGLAGFLILYGISLLHKIEERRIVERTQQEDQQKYVERLRLADEDHAKVQALGEQNSRMVSEARDNQNRIQQLSAQLERSRIELDDLRLKRINEDKQGKSASNLTFFVTSEMGQFVVITGWNYDNLNDTRPTAQYCYVQAKGNDDTSVYIARNDRPERDPASDAMARIGLDRASLPAARSHCQWFSGSNPNIH